MAAVVIGGSGLLVFGSNPTPATTLAAASQPTARASAGRHDPSRPGPASDPAAPMSSLPVP